VTLAFRNIAKALKKTRKYQKACENSVLLTDRWHDVTKRCVSSKQLYSWSTGWHWILFKYNGEGRTFWISFGHCLLALLITSLQFPSWQLQDKLNNAPSVDQNSVHTVNTDIHFMCEVPAKLNVNRTQSSYSDAEPNFFPNISKCSVFNVCITIKKVIQMKK